MLKDYLSLCLFLFSSLAFGQESEWKEYVNESIRLRAESKYDSALLLMEELIIQANKKGNYEYLSRASIELSTTYLSTKKDSFATEAIHDAIFYADKAGLDYLKMTAIYNLGMIKERQGKLDSAMYYYVQAEYYYRTASDSLNLGIVLSGIASLYSERGDRLEAIEYSINSANMYLGIKKYDYLARRYFVIGENYLILDYQDSSNVFPYYIDSAEYYYNQSLYWSDSLGFPVPQYSSLRGLAVIYDRRRDYKRALNYMYKSNDVTQQLYSANIEDKLLEFREKYNTASLELENEKKQNQILRQKESQTTIIIISIAIVVAISIWLYIVDQRRKNIKAIADKNDEINKQKIDELLQQQEIASLQGVLEGQETERKRVAIDLHDRLGGILSMVKLHFSAVEEKIDTDNPNKNKFLTASELLDLAAGEVRNISHDLMSGVLAKFGLIPALEDMKTRISETGKLKINLYTNNVNGSLNGEQELQLYRIVQELISNILKHSKAKETNIQLNKNEGSVNLIVEDDGVGFDPNKLNGEKTGIGLSNLKARVTKLDGTFHIDSGRGAGTTISIDIPVEK